MAALRRVGWLRAVKRLPEGGESGIEEGRPWQLVFRPDAASLPPQPEDVNKVWSAALEPLLTPRLLLRLILVAQMAYSTGTLAQGCFGKIYREKYNDTWAAIKRVPQHLISRKDLERECEVYNKATHPNIVKLLGNINLKDGKWVIPLEFVFGEDLETTIFKAAKSKIQLTPSNRGTIIVGMCEGLLHLHSRDIVHQDLKPENIMVEHNTNRAVIIDLGLAKFFKYGLNSAMDMGNEAYSPPEVLQRRNQRDQRSDVWAMGKIVAELCARIRLYTPSVCPEKIREIMKDQPYCHAVCRMVEPNPTLRAAIGGVIADIRRAAGTAGAGGAGGAGGTGGVAKTPPQSNLLQPPSTNARNPSPINRDASPMRGPAPFHRDASPRRRDPSPFNRDLSPRDRSPAINKGPSPFNRDLSPMNKGPSPFNRDLSPINKGPSPFKQDQFPSPLKWERSPRPELKVARAQRAEDMNRKQAGVRKGSAELAEDFQRMRLLQEAARDLPCQLPTTGRVVVRRFEEKDGEVGRWEQKEVVTRDGKIVKYDDVKFNSN